MVLLRFLAFDRKFSCCCDVVQEGGVADEPEHLMRPTMEQPSHPLTVSRTRSTFTVNSPGLPLPDLSALSITGREGLENNRKDRKNRNKNKKRAGGREATDCRLIMGACYSLRSVLSKLSPDAASLEGFHWDCPNHRLLFFS
jgi:hypothetical protein